MAKGRIISKTNMDNPIDGHIATSMIKNGRGTTIHIRGKEKAKESIRARKARKAKAKEERKEKEAKGIIHNILRDMVTEGNLPVGGTNLITHQRHHRIRTETTIARLTNRAQRENSHLTNKYVATFATNPAI